MHTPLVSIVLPYHNAATTLDECMTSICNQDFPDFELLAINDRSDDASTAIISAYESNGLHIRHIKAPCPGIVAALNRGLQLARGQFIARMDADDRMHPQRIGRQVQALQQHAELALIATQVRLFPQNAVRDGYREYIDWQNNCLSTADIAADIYIESPFAHPSVMFRRSPVLELGGYRAGNFAEDYDLWLRMFQTGLIMAKLPEVLLDWRESAHRLSRNDPRCSAQAFDQLRADYLARDRRLAGTRPQVIWGAGRQSRRRYQLLMQKGFTPSAWIDVDPAKIGRVYAGAPVFAPDWLSNQRIRPLVLVYVRNHGARRKIADFLGEIGYTRGSDYLFVG